MHPVSIQILWAIFAVVAGVKVWRLTTLIRRHLLGIPSGTERVRQTLERIWHKDGQTV